MTPQITAQPVVTTVLPDGLTVLSQALPDRRTLSLGVWVRSGSRDEPRPLLGVTHFMDVPTRENCAIRVLVYWAGVIASYSLHPQPIAAAAIRWLKRELPRKAEKLCLVHGDYRSGYFLYDQTGTIRGILDWEMAHFGDPLVDLAW